MSGTINRRSFLKMMGWGSAGAAGAALTGCDIPTTVTLEEGKEEVVSYLMPEEYVIPGIGVWYASTCAQCAAGCGTHGRVREGRVLKLEGNPESPMNNGNLCMMGQAGLQGHYNPDRIKSPMMREGGSLTPVSWEKAMAAITGKIGSTNGDKVAWFTGTVSGHQAVLLSSHRDALGGAKHYAHEVINSSVWQTVNKDMLGEANPRIRLDKAKVVLSFGADFLGTWVSPVHFAGEYAKFRTQKSRGVLIQVEPKMSLTGANADLWVAAKPGTEAAIALGIANILVKSFNKDVSSLPESVRGLIASHDAATVAKQTGVDAERLQSIAKMLNERAPSLVLAGASVEGQTNAYATASAIMLLNHLLGNVGSTIESSGTFPFAQLQAVEGDSASLAAFANDAKQKKLDVVFFSGSNPAYSAPDALGLSDAMANIGMKVAISSFLDETTMQADVILPATSYIESWGTHVAGYQPGDQAISMQQPLMEKLYDDTKSLGDVLIDLLKVAKKDEYSQYADYYAYLRHAHSSMPAATTNQEESWNAALQHGLIKVTSAGSTLSANVADIDAPKAVADDSQYPLHLVPSARLGLWDGRHANLSWLQEAPDQISKVVWDSWAEIHPTTAKAMGIKAGNMIKVQSAHGEITVKAILLKSVHPDVIAVPMGQGHTEYGRYAKGLGANPLKILSAATDAKTGQLATYATRVKISKTSAKDALVKMGGSDTQMGRKFVVTIPADQIRRTEGV